MSRNVLGIINEAVKQKQNSKMFTSACYTADIKMKVKKLGMEIEISILMNNNEAVIIRTNENQIPTLWRVEQIRFAVVFSSTLLLLTFCVII